MCIIFIPIVFSGCVTAKKEVYIYPFPKKIKSEKQIARAKGVVEGIRDRNETIENSPKWIDRSYESLMIRDIRDVPRAEYEEYAKYARGGRAFVIVHPSYFTFFQKDDRLVPFDPVEEAYPKNLVERLYERSSFFDDNMKIMQEQERNIAGFLEALSSEELLVLLVLPKGYKDFLNRDFVGERDEYARYINEITNESASVLYVESSRPDQGFVAQEAMDRILALFDEAWVKRIYLGGGYVGRCLQDFYKTLSRDLGRLGLRSRMDAYIVPEMTAVSPLDLKERWTEGLLNDKGRINYKRAASNLKEHHAYNIQSTVPLLRRFHVHEFEFEQSTIR